MVGPVSGQGIRIEMRKTVAPPRRPRFSTGTLDVLQIDRRVSEFRSVRACARSFLPMVTPGDFCVKR